MTRWTWVQQALGDGEGQGALVCCSPWGYKDTTERLNNKHFIYFCYSNCSSFDFSEFVQFVLFLWDCLVVFRATCYSDPKQCSRLILYISCPIVRIFHLSMESCFFLQQNDITHQELSLSLLLLLGCFCSRLSWQIEKCNTCMYINLTMHICNISVCSYLYLY